MSLEGTQSAGDMATRDDVVKTVSGSGVSTSLHKASSDAYPECVGIGARRKESRLSPTSGARRGGPPRPVATSQSAPEAAAAAAGVEGASTSPHREDPLSHLLTQPPGYFALRSGHGEDHSKSDGGEMR